MAWMLRGKWGSRIGSVCLARGRVGRWDWNGRIRSDWRASNVDQVWTLSLVALGSSERFLGREVAWMSLQRQGDSSWQSPKGRSSLLPSKPPSGQNGGPIRTSSGVSVSFCKAQGRVLPAETPSEPRIFEAGLWSMGRSLAF